MTTLANIIPPMVAVRAAIQGGYSSPDAFQNALQGGDASVQGSSLDWLKKLAQGGAIGFDPNGQWFSNQSAIDNILPTVGGMPQSKAATIEFEQPGQYSNTHVVLGPNGQPQISQSSYNTSAGAANVANPNDVGWDPNYGWVTDPGNVKTYNKNSFLDNLASTIGPGLIGAGLGAGFGALAFPGLAPGVGQLFQGAMSNLESGKFNPISFIPGADQLAGAPSWLTPLLQFAANSAKGGGINPIGAGTTFARLFAQGGGNG